MAAPKTYDVVALGAVVVDVQLQADDKHLEAFGIQKGLSNLVSSATVDKIADGLSPRKSAGGPGANVAAGIALRGGSSALIGKIANDDNGTFLAQRFADNGIDYTPLLSTNPATGTTAVLVMTTPDKERTFAFAAGASMELAPEDIDASLVANAKITYLDSYLWLTDSGREAVHHAANLAEHAGGKIALALNDAKIVENNRAAFFALAKSHADILVGDMKEFMTLCGTTTLEDTAQVIADLGCTAAITAGAKGAYVVDGGTVTHVPAQKIDKEKIVDTNGAGDQFAAGFIYGLSQGMTPVESATQGTLWASDIIQHFGAEPKFGKTAPPAIQNPAPNP